MELYWILNIASVFVLCIFLAGIVIPQILLIAFRKKLFDDLDERKIHKGVVPRLGGIAFKPVVFFSFALALGINIILGKGGMFLLGFQDDLVSFAFGFCSVMILYLVGMADDLIGVRYLAKFAVQILCGVMLIAGGIWLSNLHGIFCLYELPKWFAYPLTVLVVVFIINAINLIDGIDGLASGLCSVALAFYGVTFFTIHEYIYSMLSFATLGVLIPFFYYNVFGDVNKRKKIFMGDTGALTIGMMICFLSVKLSMCTPTGPVSETNPMVLAFAPLIIPCFDVVRVYFHRLRNKCNPFLPDKNHIHHKLLAVGISQRKAMITILLVSVIISFCNIIASKYIHVNILLLVDMTVWTLFNIWLSSCIKKHQRQKAISQ